MAGHVGDVEESYLHSQGFDEALFTPMNQITSLCSPRGNAVDAVGLFSNSVAVRQRVPMTAPAAVSVARS
jgi:hypothetical protein